MFDPQKPHSASSGSPELDLRTFLLPFLTSEGPLLLRIVADKPERHRQLVLHLVFAFDSFLLKRDLC